MARQYVLLVRFSVTEREKRGKGGEEERKGEKGKEGGRQGVGASSCARMTSLVAVIAVYERKTRYLPFLPECRSRTRKIGSLPVVGAVFSKMQAARRRTSRDGAA